MDNKNKQRKYTVLYIVLKIKRFKLCFNTNCTNNVKNTTIYIVFTASKRSRFYILFAIAAASDMCRSLKMSPRTESIVQIILFLPVF